MKNVFSLLQESALKYPDKICIIDRNRRWTYREVCHKAAGLAELMEKHSVTRGDRIPIYLENSAEYVVAFFSVLLLNAIAVPINKNTTMDNLRHILNDTRPNCILSNELIMGRCAGNIDFGGCRCINIDSILKELPSCGRPVQPMADNTAPAVLLYTSGTTRMPKGVTLTHGNLLANTCSILEYLCLTTEDSILATINFSYSYGNSLLLTHIKSGGTIVIENRSSYPAIVLEQLYESRVTGFSTVGSYINLLLKQESLRAEHFRHLRYITFAGESTGHEDIVKLQQLAPHVKIFVMYGQTEATARLSYLPPSMLFEKAGSIGRGIPGVTLRVVSEDGRDVVPGETGEIIASGENIMKGYWNNEADTKTVIRDGWLYTGDLAVVDGDGYIYVKGRRDDIIKYLGHRISPAEIEAVINTCGQVVESAVIGVDGEEGKQIKAYVVSGAETPDADEIAMHVRRHLPPFKRPHIIEFVRELPRTANGKIKRSELRK